ncbi:MAG: CaiB/BaiF CoA transferase family protein [Rhodoblastus sp.]
MEGLFAGLKVLDCASFIAAPAAATVLSDFGADVIKIEPPTGDAYRHTASAPGQPATEHNFPWIVDARNKRSIAVDLTSEDGGEILRRLAIGADVFITNYPARVRKKLGFDYPALKALNPRIIYASFSGYGEKGAEAEKPGFDTTAWWARSGMMDFVRAAGAPPARSSGGMGDHPSALAVLSGILMALYRREKTGVGAEVVSSLIANGIWANAFLVQAALCGAVFSERKPREQATNALATFYQCRDGQWLILSIHNEERLWPELVACLERPDLAEDPRFATKPDRQANVRALIDEMDAAFSTRDRADWRQRLNARGILFEIVAPVTDVPGDPQALENDILVPFADSDLKTVNSPLWISGEKKIAPRMAPGLGQHTDEVLREIGFADEDIFRMRTKKAVV